MMVAVSSVLPKAVASLLREVFLMNTHKAIKLLLVISALFHASEFFFCNIFFAQFSTPFFLSPVATLTLEGKESFLYAYSITRQYGFFAVQLALLALFAATNPTLYQHVIRLLALTRCAMAGLGIYVFAQGVLTPVQLIPSLLCNLVLAFALFRFTPTERAARRLDDELALLSTKQIFGITLSSILQWRLLQTMCLVAGGLWMLWGLGSTVFWEIGVANISSNQAAEMNLLNAMQANFVVRNQQGIMLFGIGAITALAAYFPVAHTRLLEFVMAQQVINALSAVVELAFGAILLPQFFTVFAVQVATLILFYALYPKATERVLNETKKEA